MKSVLHTARRGKGNIVNDYSALIRVVFGNLLSAIAKMQDAPMSAQTHLDFVIDKLAKATTWRPDDPELRQIIDDATEHMKHHGG